MEILYCREVWKKNDSFDSRGERVANEGGQFNG